MSEPGSLAVLLAHAERQRDQALAGQQRTRLAADAAAAQSLQLLDYRRDYESRWSSRFQRQGDIQLVLCYQQFMGKLSLAVDHQARVCAHATEQVALAESELRAAELRCASVRKLIERRAAERRLGDERREQKQTDEQATRTAWAGRDAATRPF